MTTWVLPGLLRSPATGGSIENKQLMAQRVDLVVAVLMFAVGAWMIAATIAYWNDERVNRIAPIGDRHLSLVIGSILIIGSIVAFIQSID